MIPIPDQIRGLIAYIVSLDVVLAAVTMWLQSFGNTTSNAISMLVALAGLVITALTGVKIWENIKIARIERKIKELELKEKKTSSTKIIK
jgi:di/tricarboxylate transporter